ncbi:MAG: histidine phosphatase family protein, partial [Giesbergeria sp.]
ACAVRKGAVWWLRQRQRVDTLETVLLAVQSPELL